MPVRFDSVFSAGASATAAGAGAGDGDLGFCFDCRGALTFLSTFSSSTCSSGESCVSS